MAFALSFSSIMFSVSLKLCKATLISLNITSLSFSVIIVVNDLNSDQSFLGLWLLVNYR